MGSLLLQGLTDCAFIELLLDILIVSGGYLNYCSVPISLQQ